MVFNFRVDDGFSLAASRHRHANVVDSMAQAANALELLGFTVADRTSGTDLNKIIGYAPQRSSALLRGPGFRVHRLHCFFRLQTAADDGKLPEGVDNWREMFVCVWKSDSLLHQIFRLLISLNAPEAVVTD